MKQGGPSYESLVLAYIAHHPGANKYELAKNVQTHAHLKGIPYSTLSLWIKDMEGRGEIVASKLGKTRAGLEKTGYRITPGALHWIADALDAQQLMKVVRQQKDSLPVPPELIEEAIRSTGNASRVMQAVTDLRFESKNGTFDDYFGNLLMTVLWDLDFDDVGVQREFVSAVIEGAAEVNAGSMNRRDFAASMGPLIEDESRFMANATKTLEIVKDTAQKLSRS